MMRTTLFLALLVGCGEDKPDDSAPPEPEDEVCDDGVDNDLDGNVDCEDSDCMDDCVEDCSDGVDNDADSDVDCHDDECTGAAGCEEFVSFSLVTDLKEVMLVSGYYVQYLLGYDAALIMQGYVGVQGYPDNPDSPPFLCSGYIYGFPSNLWHGSYHGTTYLSAHGGSSYTFEVEWSQSGNSLDWYDPCPLTSLPTFNLRLAHYQDTLVRQAHWGGWYAQYDGQNSTYSYTDDEPGYEMYSYAYSYWYSLTQSQPVTWREEIQP